VHGLDQPGGLSAVAGVPLRDYVLSRRPLDNTYCLDSAVISIGRMDPLFGAASKPFQSGYSEQERSCASMVARP
jgi:hypothetical protein